MNNGGMLLGFAGAVAWSLTLLALVVFILVVATVVRKHRPDAAPILLLALSLELLLTLASVATQLVLPRLMLATGDMTRYFEVQAITTVTVGLSHLASRALLIWGVVRLATAQSSRPE